MMLAIFLFLVSILVLASNIHIYIKSMDDTIKAVSYTHLTLPTNSLV